MKFSLIFLVLVAPLLSFSSSKKVNKKVENKERAKITYFGEIEGYGIGKMSKPSYLDLKKVSVSELRSGGYIVLMRHTKRGSLSGATLWDADRRGKCITGSELSELGIQQAKTIKETMQKLSIPIEKVYSSPTCRTKQLAKIAFSENIIEMPELIYQPMMKFHEKTFYDIELLKILSKPLNGSGNRFISAHNNTLERLGIEGVPTSTLAQGDAAVISPLGNMKFKYHGTIKLDEWSVESSNLR